MKLTVKTKGKNFVLYNEGYIRIDGVRLSFPHVAYPQENTNEEGNASASYNLVAILEKDTHAAVRKALVDMNNEILRENADKNGKAPAIARDKRYLKDGDEKDEDDNRLHRDEYENAWTVSTSNRNRPTARDARGVKLDDLSEIETMFYSGCRANILVRPWYFNGKAKNAKQDYPKRLSCSFEAIQFNRDDEPFGAARPDDDDVWEVQEGADSPFDDANGDDDEL